MGRYTGPKWKQSRREGVELREEGKHALTKRNYPPGIHGPMSFRKRLTSYGKQLREKQKAKRIYGVREKQFLNYYKKATNMSGNAADNLRTLLENRLDNAVYRLGWAISRQQARQLVTHGHIQIAGKKVDIPSFQVATGMLLTIKPSYQDKPYWKETLPKTAKKEMPSWITYDAKKVEATITTAPDLDVTFSQYDTTLIIEFYSK
jgi:small subunit ribosomal protein S4